MDDKPIDHIAVAPPESDEDKPAVPEVREALDSSDHAGLAQDPGHEDGKLDVGLDESFPTSDPPAATQPGHGEPMPSSGYNEEEEKRLADAGSQA